MIAMSSGSKHLVGKSAQSKGHYEGSFGAFCSVFRPNENLSGNYISYFFQSNDFRKNISEISKGSNINNLKREHILDFVFPIPPLPIQRAIVSKIEALFSDLDNGIANFKKAQEQLKIYRQAVLKKAFEGELTREWREKQTNLPTAEELLQQIKQERQNHYNQQIEEWKKAVKKWEKDGKVEKKPSKPTQLKELILLEENDLKELSIIPDCWFYSEIGNICDCIVPNRDKPKSFSGDIKWITTPDLDEKLIKLDYSKIELGLTKNEAEKYNARVIPVNSVIMTCVGTLGLSSIVEKEIVINQQLHAFLPEKYYLPKLLAYYIRLNKNFYERISTSTTIQYINKDKCNSLPFPLSSLSEQTQIVQEIERRLSVCDKMEQSIKESLAKAEALRQSILKKAFEGKLLTEAEIQQCKQEADYEPASELLKKITNEKLRMTNEKKVKKVKIRNS
ncbi:restriction endonuclease subunit S [Flectobacillus sp. BAB-3569]|uniref:restriction endonuclease subunit S n=1 Tax=Flectobacillus sp. BAB-3569 TaxID=1509483 RepID=UPI0038D3DF5F